MRSHSEARAEAAHVGSKFRKRLPLFTSVLIYERG